MKLPGGGTNLQHVACLCSKQEEIWLRWQRNIRRIPHGASLQRCCELAVTRMILGQFGKSLLTSTPTGEPCELQLTEVPLCCFKQVKALESMFFTWKTSLVAGWWWITECLDGAAWLPIYDVFIVTPHLIWWLLPTDVSAGHRLNPFLHFLYSAFKVIFCLLLFTRLHNKLNILTSKM